jgi:cell wall-associated NlpC family hydrolase
VNGQSGWTEDIGDALTDLSIQFDIDGTPTIIAQVEDPHRTLLRSNLALQRSSMTIDGVTFIMAEIDKQGPQITLTFEHAVCSKLKDHTETVSARANLMTRTSFVAKLVSYEVWIQMQLPGGPSIGNSVELLSTGNVDPTTGGAVPLPYSTTFQELETFWDSTGSILATIGWRRFPRGANQLIVASDQWLYNQAPIATIDEDTPGVDSIDFNYDIRKPLGSITITCRAEAWAFPVGSVIAFTPAMGIIGVQDYGSASTSGIEEEDTGGQLPPVAGHWLVTTINRSLLSATATITLDIPLLTLSEPQTQPPTDPANEVASALASTPVLSLPGGAQSGKNASPQVASFVAFAKSKVGGPYVWGGTGPTGYDCSGLVQGAAKAIGVSFPHNSVEDYTVCTQAQTTCTVETAIATYGALLFIAPGTNGELAASQGGGHIAISLGNGQTVEATGAAEGICYNVANASRFNQGALLPGVTY